MGSDRHLILQLPSDASAYLKVDQETLSQELAGNRHSAREGDDGGGTAGGGMVVVG